jgi:hypothetical protein
LRTYKVGLCRMTNGTLDAPYLGDSVEALSTADVIHKAKAWAANVDVAEGSWLQVLLDGKSVASLKPGSF